MPNNSTRPVLKLDPHKKEFWAELESVHITQIASVLPIGFFN